MIFVKLAPESFGEDPIMGYSQFIDDLIHTHTQAVFEAYQQALLHIEYPDKEIVKLDDEISRYADDELSFYSFEEKIDPDYFYIGLNGRTEKGMERINEILLDVRRHPGFRGRVFGYRIAAIISDEPQCIPCRKKKLDKQEKENLKLNKGGV